MELRRYYSRGFSLGGDGGRGTEVTGFSWGGVVFSVISIGSYDRVMVLYIM